VLAREFGFRETVTAIGAHIAITDKKLAVGKARSKLEGVDAVNPAGAYDAVDMND